MAINTEIWGTPDTWLQVSDITTEALKVSPQTVYTAINNGLMALNKPLDSSVSYARFNSAESDLAYYNYAYYDEDNIVQFTHLQMSDETFVTTPCYGAFLNEFKPNLRTAYGQTFSNISGQSGNLGQKPLTFFDVQKIVLLIFVSYVRVNPTDGIPYNTPVYNVPLQEYENYTGEKYIVGYGYSPYYGGPTRKSKTVSISMQSNWNNIPIPQNLPLSETRANMISPYTCAQIDVNSNSNYFMLGGENGYFQPKSYTYITKNYVDYIHGNPENWSFYPSSDNSIRIFSLLTVDNEIEYIKKQIARLGFWFTDNTNSALYSETGVNCTDERMYCPSAPVNGLFTGDYYAGSANESNPVASWTGDGREYIVVPSDGEEIDTNVYTDTILGQLPNLSGLGSFSNVYAVTSNNLKSLSDWLWYSAVSDDTSTVFLKKLGLIGDNPLSAIISLQAYPFDVTNYIQGNLQTLQVGYNTATNITTQTALQGVKLDLSDRYDNGLTARIDFGTINLSQHFFNFFDYEPYTAITLYIPFVGFVDLTPSQIVGHNIRVVLDFEVLTGACVGTVYIDNTVLVSKNGKLSIDIPLTGVNSAEYANAVNNSALDSKQNAVNMVTAGIDSIASLASGNIGGVLSGITSLTQTAINAERIQNNREFLAPSYSSSGGYTANSSTFLPYYPYLQITRPIIQDYDTTDYRQSLGYACNIPCKISDCSGYCEFAQVNFDGITATETELRELHSLLQNGVIL